MYSTFTNAFYLVTKLSVTTLTVLCLVGGAYGKDTTGEIPREGQTLPEICFTDRFENPLCLSQWRGRVVLLNVWATWCGPCRKEMPQLNGLQSHFERKDFEVVALSVDRRGVPAVIRYLSYNNLQHLSVYVDPDVRVNETLAARGIPYSLLIDRNGRVVEQFRGVVDWESPVRLASIQALIGRPIH
jgi:thiol-disulfide isomerase/thioredoxin